MCATKLGKCWRYTGEMLQNLSSEPLQHSCDLVKLHCIFKSSTSRHLLLVLYSSNLRMQNSERERERLYMLNISSAAIIQGHKTLRNSECLYLTTFLAN